MFRPRIIPVLLLKGKGLVKTIQFSKEKYIGDPINAVRIFNDLEADELIFLDINASRDKRVISDSLVQSIGDEAFMPFGVGGGIATMEQIERLLKSGAEKVILCTHAFYNSNLVKEASKNFGSQSIVVSIDAKKSFFGKYEVFIAGGKINTKANVLDFSKKMQDSGAGEIIINSIDNDGMMRGYDLKLVKNIASSLSLPVIACGGCGTLKHLAEGYYLGGAHALAAGSMFVFHGPRNAVLINYPEKKDLMKLFNGGV